MKPVKVVTDTTANVPPDLAEKYDIRIVPYCIQFGTETFLEGQGLTREEFHRRIDEGVFPKTSQPPLGEFAQAFAEAAQEASGILCVTLTAAHSGGYATATAAKELVPGIPIEVVDSKAISLGTGFLALAAARAAQQGHSLQDILRLVLEIRSRLHHYIAIDTLRYLQMGGRVSAFQNVLATMLNVKPILHVKDGMLVPYERVRTRARSLERIVEAMVASLGTDAPVRVAALHDQAAEDCGRVLGMLKSRLNVQESFTGELALALACHSGPGMVGIIGYTIGPDEAQ